MKYINRIQEYLSGLFKKQGKKKLVENAAIVIVIGIIAVIASGSLLGPGKKAAADVINREGGVEAEEVSARGLPESSALEKEIGNFLTKIKGVGKVSVMVTYASTTEMVPAYETDKSDNQTEEKDSGGGTRSINQTSFKDAIVYEELPGGGKRPVVVKENMPEVKGIAVAADGASDPVIRESICKAVEALLDVPMHRIQVFERQ